MKIRKYAVLCAFVNYNLFKNINNSLNCYRWLISIFDTQADPQIWIPWVQIGFKITLVLLYNDSLEFYFLTDS